MTGIKALSRLFAIASIGAVSTFAGCATPPHRSLTAREIKTARAVFRDKIDYAKVNIHYGAPSILTQLDPNCMATTPNGQIYCVSREFQRRDMTDSDVVKELFMHEMAHVWQFQQGRNIRLEAVLELFRNGLKYSKSYDYTIADLRPFSRMKLEQQAQLIQDYIKAQDILRTDRHPERKRMQGLTLPDFIERARRKIDEIFAPSLPASLPTPGPLRK